jgi:thiamine biosynthesis protein ThiC
MVLALANHSKAFEDAFDRAINDLDIEKIINDVVENEGPKIIEHIVRTAIENNIKAAVGRALSDARRNLEWDEQFSRTLTKKIEGEVIKKLHGGDL